MSIIERNLSFLNSFDFEEECRGLSMRQVNGKFVSHINVMVNKDSGELLKMSKKAYALPDSLITLVEIQRPVDSSGKAPSHLTLKHLGPIGQALPETVTSTIDASLQKFNEQP